MEVAAGAMSPLLRKLGELLAGELKLERRMKEGVRSLRTELELMHATLIKVGEVPPDQLDMEVRIWAGKVRDLSYDMEDAVDGFMVRVEDGRVSEPTNAKNRVKKFFKETTKLFTKGKALHQISNAIQEAQDQARELAEQHSRYKIEQRSTNDGVNIDPRLITMYKDVTELVGIEESRDELIQKLTEGDERSKQHELIQKLTEDDEGSKQKLKTISIVGFGGLGKTTLAKVVYDKMKVQFDCGAFVSVGRNAEVKRVFCDILLEIDKQKYTNFSAATLDESQYIDELRELLENKRYLIVLDDIWDTRSWEIIACALIDNNLGSIVITTTRVSSVAVRAGDVYKLEPLSRDHSEKLFYTSLSGGKIKSCDQTTKLVENILHKCGGVPLAIIAIASLLSNKPKEDWDEVYNSIDLGHGDNGTLGGMRTTLLLCYYDLPPYLKICLLHLSIVSKDYMVMKDTLIWKWVAEGFVQQKPGVGLFELGERYFDELIERSMVQPIEISHSGIIIGYRVHDIMLDFICSVASDESFVTILDGNEQQTYSQSKVRRLALQNRVVERHNPLDNMHMAQVRSFNAIMCHTSMIPSLSRFAVLRVLAIEDCSVMEDDAYLLEYLGRLLQLRYLGLWKTPIRELPQQIGNLKFLQTLDLRQTKIQELPRSVSLLSQLRCLRANGGSIRVPDWIGKLTSLEELSLNDVSNCPNFVKELGKLTELRDLKIWIRVLDERSKKALVKSLVNLQKIRVLHLDGGLWIDEADWEGYVPPRQLRHLILRTKSSRLPRWINSSLLPNLSHLSVDVKVVEAQDMEILGSFQELLTLNLFVPNVPLDIRGGTAFPKLRHCYASGMLRFLRGAAPRLESVNFNALLWDLKGANFEFGSLGNLPLLQKVRVEIFYSVARGATEVADVEAALRQAVRIHPNCPVLDVSKYKWSCKEQCDENEDDEDEEEEEQEEDEDEEEECSPTAKAS